MKKAQNKLAVAIGLTSALTCGSALATPFTELFFTQDAGWSDDGFTFNPGTTGFTGINFFNPTGGDAPANTFEDMSWCSPLSSNCSSINISTYDDDTPPIVTLDSTLAAVDGDGEWNEGDWWSISRLLQTNAALTAPGGASIGDPLWIVETLANLRIYTDSGKSDLLGEDLNASTVIEFTESRNSGCSNNPLGTTCDDIFQIAAVDFDPISFVRDGFVYQINFTLVPGPSSGGVVSETLVCPSSDPLCLAATIDPDEIWVFTPEANVGTSSVDVLMSWTVREFVPSPAALTLLGGGFLAMFGMMRRRERV